MKIIGPRTPRIPVAGMYLVSHNRESYLFADAAVNIDPTAEELAEITVMAAEEMERLQMEPRVGMLSFSNFGSVRTPETEKIDKAVKLVRERRPDIPVDGPVQPDIALTPELIRQYYPFADMHRSPNLLIFPNLAAGNISLRLLQRLSHVNTIGPIIIGLAKPIHALPRFAEVSNIINLAAIASVDAQGLEEQTPAKQQADLTTIVSEMDGR